MSPPTHLNFITGNANKLKEVKAILGSTIELRSQALDLLEIQGTIDEISADKCRRAADAVCFSFLFCSLIMSDELCVLHKYKLTGSWEE